MTIAIDKPETGIRHPKGGRAGRFWLTAVAVVATGSMGWGVFRAVTSSNDLLTRYQEWSRLLGSLGTMGGWDQPYHPVLYLLLTLVFAYGFDVAKLLFLALNLACLGYSWRRLSDLLALEPPQRGWLLAMLGCWACVRVTIGSGQLGLICLATVLWAYPFQRGRDGIRLSLGVIKHTLLFPVWVDLLLRRPRLMLATAVVAVLPLGAAWLAGDGDWFTYWEGTRAATTRMLETWDGGAYIGVFLKPYFQSPWLMHAVIWAAWGLAFFALRRRIQDDVVWLAVLLLMSLWPVYHRAYDLVVAAPTLALFLKHRRTGWVALLAVAMAGGYERLEQLAFLQSPVLRQLGAVYYPVLIALLVAALTRLDPAGEPGHRRFQATSRL